MTVSRTYLRWALVQQSSKEKFSGQPDCLIHKNCDVMLFKTQPDHLINKNCDVMLFKTQRAAKEAREAGYGYIRQRQDLRNAGWLMPRIVKVRVTVTETTDRITEPMVGYD
jgi:hypothetical protein